MILTPTKNDEQSAPHSALSALPPTGRHWLPELFIILLGLLVSTWLCLRYPIDLELSRWFYQPPGAASTPHWPYGALLPWRLFNKADVALTIGLAVSGLAFLACGFARSRWRRYRRYGLFIVLSLLIGPGLLVNVVLKDHWGRPRPVDITEFGGNLAYRPPLLKGRGPGRSFPSGHASVAFEYLVFWFIWRRKKRWAVPVLLGGLALGGLMGFARLAAGAHFLSDIIWSAGLTYLVSFILYYFVLRMSE